MTIGLVAQPTGARGVDQAEVERRVVSAGVPVRFVACRFATFRRRPGVVAAAKAAHEVDGTHGVVLSGPPGTGKTHLAVAILAARIEAWLTEYPDPFDERLDTEGRVAAVSARPNLAVRFVVVPSLLDRMRSAIRWADSEDPLPSLVEADLVVLDDLGRERVTDWATERLYVLVNERYNAMRSTVVTTNYGPDELVARGYDALVSRLLEGAGMVEIRAGDFRQERP